VRNRYVEGFVRILPILIILISIAGLLIGGIVLERWDYSVRGLIVAIPAIIASIVLLSMFKHPIDDDRNPIIYFSVKTCPYLLFILLYLISLIILLAGINRLLYFFVVASLYLTIFIQIFSQKISSKAIILEIVSVMVNVIYSTTLVYPLFFRTTDILIHNTLSKVTFLSGHTIPVDLEVSYATFPLFHIYNAVSSNILGLSAKDTHFIVMCLVFVIVIFFLYKIFQILSDNEQVPLLTCLCFSVIPTVLTRGIEMVTSITAFVGFVILLYLIFSTKERNLFTFHCLLFLITIFIILVHQVSIAQIALLLILLIICEYILNKKKYFFNYHVLFLIVSFVAYWIFSSFLFTEQLIRGRVNLNYFDFGEKFTVLSDPSMNQMEIAISFLLNQIDMGIFIFFALIGIVYILYRQKPQYLPVIAIFSLIAFLFYIPNPLFTSQTIARIYRIDRFWILLAPFMAFIMASGIFWLSKWTEKFSRSKIFRSLIVILFAFFILLSLQQPILQITSKEGRLYFTDGELSGYDFVFEKIPYGSKLHSDYHTTRFFHLDYFSLSDELELPYYKSNFIIADMAWLPHVDQYVIFRDLKFEDGGVYIQLEKGRGGMVNYPPKEPNINDVMLFYGRNNIIYRNNQATVLIGRYGES